MLQIRNKGRRDRRSLWDKTWKDRGGKVIIFQMPNAWLIAWTVLSFISLLSSSSRTASIFWWLSVASLVVWSLLEIFRGPNYFRRGLGIFVLLVIASGIFGVGL